MQKLVERAAKVTSVLEIKGNAIYNKVTRVEKEHKDVANACTAVSPKMSESFPVHAKSIVTVTASSGEVFPSPLLDSFFPLMSLTGEGASINPGSSGHSVEDGA
jgi:hypothetical protein